MTIDLLLKLLRSHLAALQSSAWPCPYGPSDGPAIYLDAADTKALIKELTNTLCQLETARAGSAPILRPERGFAWRVGKTAKDLADEGTSTRALTASETRTDELTRNSAGRRPSDSIP
jgi:hypothetical protein